MRTLERLAAIDGVRLHGIADPARVDERTPTFCLTVDGVDAARRSPRRSAREGIFTWDGNYYALEAIRALGLEDGGGALRVGYLHYTTRGRGRPLPRPAARRLARPARLESLGPRMWRNW